MRFLAIVMFFGLLTPSAFAAPKTVTLLVPGMTCAVCPITVKKSLTRVSGVTHVDVSYETRQAVVTFDDSKTGVDTLRNATANAGYPSTLKQ